jgi:ABC-type Fe3+/spermidine/putrescine transport system ATPase subunit
MQAGRIEQLDLPENVYRKPKNLFVAKFMGTTNVLQGTVGDRNGDLVRVHVGASELSIADPGTRKGEPVSLCVRPETLRIVPPADPGPVEPLCLEATVTKTEFIGPLARLEAALDDGTTLRVAVLDNPNTGAMPGSRILLAYDPARITVFRQGSP